MEVKVNCSRNEAVVSWYASDGALSYKVAAASTQGAASFCETAELTCTLTNLTCGHHYFVQVVAQDDICSSLPSPAVEFKSGRKAGFTSCIWAHHCFLVVFFLWSFSSHFRISVPCRPDIGSVILDCFTNSALLDWKYAEGAVYYVATARSSSSSHISTCNSNFTNCELQDLQCGQTYNVITVASNDECSSSPSTMLQVDSGKHKKQWLCRYYRYFNTSWNYLSVQIKKWHTFFCM